jgi:uncharacterized membrane protein YoaK (UPF0700 family)
LQPFTPIHNDDPKDLLKGLERMKKISDPKQIGGEIADLTEAHQVPQGSGSPPPASIAVPRTIPIVLSVVAGYVDACTYLGLFGVFVAQLTGSLVLAGTELFKSESGALAKFLAIPSFFLAGMAITVLVRSMRARPRAALAWSLAIECMLLLGLFASCLAGMPFRGLDAPEAIATLLFGMAAMGAQSALVRLLMQGVASTNVMTTNTTVLAINAAEMLLGWIERNKADQPRTSDAGYAQARREIAALLSLWIGFFAGTVLGAIAYITVGLPCVLLAVFPVGSLALWYARPAELAPGIYGTPDH